VSEEVLEEGCYYLSELGLGTAEIAHHFEISEERARSLASSYSRKLESHRVPVDSLDLQFWEDVKKEAEGDTKLTFVSDRGFHHSWKSEVSKLDPGALMNIYESSKDFINADPNQRFLDYPPPKGYDPLAAEREVKKSVEVVRSLLDERWSKDSGKTHSGHRKDEAAHSGR
jgi:hypothetical protein